MRYLTRVLIHFYIHPFSVSASASILARLACRWVMAVGSSTVWSTASSRTDRCPATSQLAAGTIPSTRSLVKLAPANMSPELSSSIWNPRWLVSFPKHVNLFKLRDAHMLQWNSPSLAEIMACRLFDAKATIWTNTGVLLVGSLRTNFSELE